MKLSLLLAAFMFIGILGGALGCGRLAGNDTPRVPNYADISKPKRIINGIAGAHGICIARNGNFAIIPYKKGFDKFFLYDSCGNLMKEVQQPSGSSGHLADCVFTEHHLFVTDIGSKKMYKYTADDLSFIKVVDSGKEFERLAVSRDGRQIYVAIKNYRTVNGLKINTYENDKLISSFAVNSDGGPRGIVVDRCGQLEVAIWNSGKILRFTPEGVLIKTNVYEEVKKADGFAIDRAGNVLVPDRGVNSGKLMVYSPGGAVIKTIKGLTMPVDVDINYDGTVVVADPHGSGSVLLY